MNAIVLLAATLLVSDLPGEKTYHMELTVTSALPSGNVPMDPSINFGGIISGAGLPGVLDPNSIELINKTAAEPTPFALTEDFAYGDSGRLEWVIGDPGHTTFEIRFRTAVERPPLIPQTYTPQVGIGDLLRYNAGEPRPFSLPLDARLVDLTGDGKRDLVGRWNYAYRPGDPWDAVVCFPRVGELDRFEFGDLKRVNYSFSPRSTNFDVDCDGRLDAISLMTVSGEGLSNYRVGWRRNLGGSYAPVEPLDDIDCEYPREVEVINDGPRRGLLVTHNHCQYVSFYESTGTPSGPYFQKFGRAESVSAVLGLSDQAWPSVCDWDGDGDQDLLVGGGYGWPRILVNEGTNGRMALAAPQKILSEGQPIRITRNEVLGPPEEWHDMGYPYPTYVDWDDDGLPDLMLPNETNRIFWYKNIGTRADPQFGPRIQVLCDGYPDSPELRAQTAALVANPNTPNRPYPYEECRPFFWRTGAAFADFNDDGLMDMVTHDGYTRKATLFTQYRDGEGDLHLQEDYALRLSDGRLIDDQIVNRSKHWTESFRAIDWDDDGLIDLIYNCAGSHGGIKDGGSIYLLRNCGTASEPLFEPPVTMRCFGDPIRITNHGPNAWPADFDGDGKLDLVTCVEWSVYPFYNNNALTMSARPQYTLSPVQNGGSDPGLWHRFMEDWNTDPGEGLGGWSGDSLQWVADGGPDGSGHLRAYRAVTYLPYMRTTDDPVRSEVGGNLYARYGESVEISLDAMIEDGSPPDETGYGWWVFDNNGELWYKNLETPGNTPTEWTHYSELIYTVWSDAEANANGWFSFNSSLSWQYLMQNVAEWNFMGRALNYKGGGPYTGHLDNFIMRTASDPIPGDANLDGMVNDADAAILATNWQMTGTASWEDGDFNSDGNVSDADAAILATNWQVGVPEESAPVPEPGPVTLLAAALASLLIRRWRKRTERTGRCII